MLRQRRRFALSIRRGSLSRLIPCALVVVLSAADVSSAGDGDGRRYSLAEIVALAEQHNPSVSVFQANIAAARGALTSARAYPNPEVEVEVGKGRPLDSPGSGYEQERRFGLSQSLEWSGKRAGRTKAADAQVGVAQEALNDFRLELRAEVKEAFFQTLLAQHIASVVTQNVATARSLVESARLRVESGEAPELDLIKARVELFNVTRDSRRAENRITVAKAALNSLLGGALDHEFEVVGEPPGPATSYELSPLIQQALARHPLIARQEQALAAAGYTLSQERHARVPDLTIRGSTSEEIDKRSSSIGLALSVPLLSQRQGEIATARAGEARAQAELARTRLELTKLITQEYENYRIAVDQLTIFEEGLLKQADEALRIAQFSYQQGELDLLNLLDAQRVQRATLLQYYEARFDLQTALARLERVTGESP